MNSKEQIPMREEFLDEIGLDATSSVDDFIRELEAKEKDLHITSDMTIEIEEVDFDGNEIPAFVEQDLTVPPPSAAPATNNSAPVGMKTRLYDLENEVEALQERVRGLRAERNEIQKKSDRRLKDFENYKYRMDRERRGLFIDQISKLALQMLPVLDNLDRALDSVEKTPREKSEEFQQFYDGIALVNQQFGEIFNEMSVQPIATVGEIFDPNVHEAVAVEERAEKDANMIVEELLRGYRIGNRVIRHSMVKVTTAPQTAKKYDPAQAPGQQNIEASPEDSPRINPPEPAASNPEAN